MSRPSRSVIQQEPVKPQTFKSVLKPTWSQNNEAETGELRSGFLVLVLQPDQ